jgi:hypothetical protein
MLAHGRLIFSAWRDAEHLDATLRRGKAASQRAQARTLPHADGPREVGYPLKMRRRARKHTRDSRRGRQGLGDDQGPGFKQRFVTAVKRRFWVRLHMTLILGATGLAGVLATKALLWMGVTSLMVRYPLAALISWLAFVGVVRVWLAYAVRRRKRQQRLAQTDDGIDPGVIDFLADPTVDVDFAEASGYSGGGGRFSGGGAQGRWGDSMASGGAGKSRGGGGLGGSVGLDGDELALIIALVVLIAGICGSSLYLIYEAPSILAEAAFEFALAGGLIRAVRTAGDGDWVGSVLRATWKPFTVVLVLAALFGAIAHGLRPEATRLSEVFADPPAQ